MIYQEKDTFVFVPEVPNDIMANCHTDWGFFLTQSKGDFNVLQAKEAGILKGNKASFALVFVGTKLTKFPMDVKPEYRTHIWAIPVEGELRNGLNKKVGELINFLMTAISGEKLIKALEQLKFQAFNAWIESGGKGEYAEVKEELERKQYHSVIFDAQFVKNSKGKFKNFTLEFTMRQPKNDFEKNILKIADDIHKDNPQGFSHPRLEENQAKALAMLAPQKKTRAIEGDANF